MKSSRLLIAAAVFCVLAAGENAQCREPGLPAGPPAALAGPSADPASAGLGKPGEDIPDWLARWELARLLSYTKRYRRSVEEYRKVLKEKPDLVKARAELAQVLFWDGRKKEALAELETLPPAEQAPETLLLRADLLSQDKQYARAEKLYRRYLSQKPDDAKARFKLAQTLSWNKRYKDSLEQYSMILKALPHDRQVRRHYALVLGWDGQLDKAIEEMDRSLKE